MNDSQRVLDCVRRLVRYLRISDRAMQTSVGLSGAQLFVMRELAETPALSLSELAQRTLTDQSSVSVVVTRLVEAGYVSRDRDSIDGRRLVLNLTKAGKALMQRAPAPPQQKLLDAIDRFSPADRAKFAEHFARFVDELGGNGGAPPMMEFADAETEAKKQG